ncbi:GTP pyrophosphokinase, (p)ppGpp synthetase II / Guanosine-3',5'-bis(diphosphate) 3'-pyrophosphohydrolase [Thioalkalivibrio nitratireducens DSM 14787]|uniref:guanosine-3',5'-bis(diphosphate) 3'-diphosphatase n=1 Tax=Thioalkalivibrio nitratireducens (strain DSM 14787 / UNIQEM 213 / ALEN2) TaxID=1255043 RepID=L0E207_THIND|nr:bifunctional GTP diphosphokinase/guanosine-3',5'-bis pyrophosphate 3'-pyrophosphohydrolase [Thioalkalivibrio nitratireducens]AGA35328.1 GTP pyrophosphokinase, (p)ppGpp synthetase II / Guanosine-3',5'-bis(diphosphate) 3'-pyrophosphohydrolase [Thioalkalivibrio nitratireducens DSM 14787]
MNSALPTLVGAATEPSTDSTRFLISDLCAELESYLAPEQINEVYRAYLFGAEAHEGQTRKTGEPYIYHPLAVARTMGEMRMDHRAIVAAILHDVMEDTRTSKERIRAEFGAEVADLVDGVSKLTHLQFQTKAEAQAENFRKMMLAITRDIRVILVKLADRLHNMRTLGVMRPDKRRRIARETLEIYAPIAQRLGMNRMRRELEQLGFAALYPRRFAVLDASVRQARGHRREPMQKIEAAITHRMEAAGIEARISGREKGLYSIYRKMLDKRQPFKKIVDVFAVRIVVADVDTCYRALGVVHNLYKPVPGRFKDYIAIPKSNGYQSLHTVLFGPHGSPIEIQIRSAEMDRVAESGIAAHWQYKAGDDHAMTAQSRAREWLKDVLEIQNSVGSSIEFLENVKVDLFPDEVYTFTPMGEIMVLPRGATPVDFAYAVHSDVGNHCVTARIDRQLAPLSARLQSGQTVEIVTAPGARPNPAWLSFVVTGKARSGIRHCLKSLQSDEAAALGRRLIEKALATLGQGLGQISPVRMDQVLDAMKIPDIDSLLVEIGLGNRMAALVARQLVGQEPAQEVCEGSGSALAVKGTEGLVVNYGRCCFPIPGDPVIGILSAGRGLVVHREACRNLGELRERSDKTVSLEWSNEPGAEFAVSVRAETANRRGALAEMAAVIADHGSNIEHISFNERDGHSTAMTFTITVRDRRHLAQVIRSLRRLNDVLRVQRSRG